MVNLKNIIKHPAWVQFRPECKMPRPACRFHHQKPSVYEGGAVDWDLTTVQERFDESGYTYHRVFVATIGGCYLPSIKTVMNWTAISRVALMMADV